MYSRDTDRRFSVLTGGLVKNAEYFRPWQREALTKFFSRLNNPIEVTSAHQGTGKTIYSAGSFILYSMKTDDIVGLNFEAISIKFKKYVDRDLYFPIVVVPNKGIIYNTIKAWSKLGVTLKKISNAKLVNTSLEQLQNSKVNGLILTYQQLGYKDFISNNDGDVWVKSPLIKFIQKELTDKNIYLVLDECHEMTIKSSGFCNLKARFFLDNTILFNKIHLMSGTLVKGGYKAIRNMSLPKIPFVSYDEEGNAVPDTYYSQDDAIKDGAIVKTRIITHQLASGIVNKNGQTLEFKGREDLEWFCEHYHPKALKSREHEDNQELHRIIDSFNILYKSENIWKPLLVFGNYWLGEIRKENPTSKGIIFAPSKDAAIMLHSNLLKNKSILCVSNLSTKESTIKNINSEKLSEWLEKNNSGIDWIVSCEALKQGFDYPECKVQILVPRLEFLDIVKISQMIGRTNRKIPGISLDAVCITIENPAVEKLVEKSKDSAFGINALYLEANPLLDASSVEVYEKAVEKARLSEINQDLPEDKINIKDLLIDNTGKEKIDSKVIKINYSDRIKKELTSIRIKSYWKHWRSLVFASEPSHIFGDDEIKPDISESDLPPCRSGVYVIANSETTEVVYVGGSDNLRNRIRDLKRWRKTKWKTEEGSDNLFVKWYEVRTWGEEETKLKQELKPKYDNEKHIKYQ